MNRFGQELIKPVVSERSVIALDNKSGRDDEIRLIDRKSHDNSTSLLLAASGRTCLRPIPDNAALNGVIQDVD